MKRIWTTLIIATALTLSLTGCKKEEPPKEEPVVEEPVIEEEEVVEEPEEVMPANMNLLTGLGNLSEAAIGKRPVAVMVNNVKAAMPQYGISQADIIFEIPVEGNYTRLMAMYADQTTVPQICSIRSCRPYFPALAHGFDAYYTHWGMDNSYKEYVRNLGIDTFDGIVNYGNMFGRDQERRNNGFSLEHTAYFDGPSIPSVIESKGLRADLLEDKKGAAFLFNGLEEQLKPEGNDCTNVQVDFGSAQAGFTYDPEKKVYLKTFGTEPQLDGKTGEQLAFTNVFVLEAEITIINSVSSKAIDLEGGPDSVGYYVSNGGVQKIYWAKEGGAETAYLKFYDESGEELKINRGKSYIAFNYPGQATF